MAQVSPAPPRSRSTGKERDAESGNDYFGARYYASAMGRWLSPDYSYDYDPEPVPHADLENPQSLNLYSYVQNNPLINIDPDGHSCDQGSIGPDGVFTIHCQNDPPLNPWFAGGVMVLGNEELGPFAWGIGGALLGVGCLQAHCGQAIANLFASNNSNKAVPPAAAPANTANPNPNDNQDQKKKTSRNQMQKQVERGKAPKTVDRVDPGLGPNEQDHIHFSDGSALNEDGTWKHGGRPLTNAETEWIQQNGWDTPKQP